MLYQWGVVVWEKTAFLLLIWRSCRKQKHCSLFWTWCLTWTKTWRNSVVVLTQTVQERCTEPLLVLKQQLSPIGAAFIWLCKEDKNEKKTLPNCMRLTVCAESLLAVHSQTPHPPLCTRLEHLRRSGSSIKHVYSCRSTQIDSWRLAETKKPHVQDWNAWNTPNQWPLTSFQAAKINLKWPFGLIFASPTAM